MSKTNVYTLVATALLGVLLYFILQLASDMRTRVILKQPEEQPPDFIRETSGRRITTRAELTGFLTERGLDAAHAIEASANWRARRGFLGGDVLLGIEAADAPIRAYDALDDTALKSMSEQGDVTATQALADRTASVDPFAAIKLYVTAASQGSIFAVLRIGSLRETLGSAAAGGIPADAAFLGKLSTLRRDDPDRSPQMDAFAYATAAIRDGGIAIVDDDLLNRVRRAGHAMSPAQRAEACALSEHIFLEFGAARRSRGFPPVTTRPPTVFIGIPDIADKLPCTATAHPIIALLDLDECSIDPVENSRGESVDLYICQTG